MKQNETKDGSSNNGDKSRNSSFNPNNEFIASSLSMSWKLAIAVLVPIIGGYKIDLHFKLFPLFTIIGFVVAMTGTILIINKVFRDFNKKIQKPGGSK